MDGETRSHDLEQGPSQTLGVDKLQHEKRFVLSSPYHDQVIKPALQHRPWLENLDQFMDFTAPGFGVDLAYRMNHFDIRVIQVSISGTVDSMVDCESPGKFYQAINEDRGERSGTLVITKDISRAMIETLGTQYNLEPEFFATHLLGTETFRNGRWNCPMLQPPARGPNFLPDYLRKAPFYSSEFRRPYHIGGGKQGINEIRKQTCTPRGINLVNEELPETFALEKVSVYRKSGSKVGIILTDQLLSNISPPSYIPILVTALGFTIPSSLTHITSSLQISSRHALTSWLESLSSKERTALFDDDRSNEPLALRPILKLTESTSTMFLIHAQHTASRIVMLNTESAFPQSVSFFLHVFRALQRHVHEHEKLLAQARRLVDHRGAGRLPGMGEQLADLKALSEDLEATLQLLEEHVRFLVAAAQLYEGRVVGWVSKFAALFLPVSLLATILAISDPGYTRWAILGGLSVPFVAASAYFMFFWRSKISESNSIF